MEFDVNFGIFCYNCGGKCCEQSNWCKGEILITEGNLRELEKSENLPLIQRNDWGFRCLHFNNKKCEIYDDRPDACKKYICNNPIFNFFDNMIVE